MAMKKDDLPSNVYKQRNIYRVIQTQNGQRKTYLITHNRQEAINYRNKLYEEGILKDLTRKAGRHPSGENRYIRKSGRGYNIQKMINGSMESFGTFSSLDDARNERDLLESIDWDYSNIDYWEQRR